MMLRQTLTPAAIALLLTTGAMAQFTGPSDVAQAQSRQYPPTTVQDIKVDPETNCSIFGMRKVTGIDPNAESPLWLQRELMLCGARSVNAATDVTNYLMFLLGTPMHAFDAEKVSGALHVRHRWDGFYRWCVRGWEPIANV